MHDDYKPLDLSQFVTAPPNGRVLEPCPVCGSEAGLWQYSESETSPRKLLAMCSHGDKIGPQDGLIHEGCLLYMPGDNFYRETIRDAVRYWNEMARAIVALRNSNAGVTAPAPAATKVYCCYGAYCDAGHSSDCKGAAGVALDGLPAVAPGGWCTYCGCGNDTLGRAHLDACKRPGGVDVPGGGQQ